MPTSLFIEIGGWIGTAALLLAYGLVSTRRLEGDSVPYQVLNLIGGTLVLINSFYHGAMPSVAVNVFWIAIGLFALSRVFVARRKAAGSRPPT
jgi:hypothetical protein